MLNDAELLSRLKRHWDYSGKDEDISHEVYHEDAVLEFPQSGERFGRRELPRVATPISGVVAVPHQADQPSRRLGRRGEPDQLRRRTVDDDGQPSRVSWGQGRPRAHLHYGPVGRPRLARPMALGATCGPGAPSAHAAPSCRRHGDPGVMSGQLIDPAPRSDPGVPRRLETRRSGRRSTVPS